jgi:hypothetical protein
MWKTTSVQHFPTPNGMYNGGTFSKKQASRGVLPLVVITPLKYMGSQRWKSMRHSRSWLACTA